MSGRFLLHLALVAGLLAAAGVFAADEKKADVKKKDAESNTYDQDSVLKDAGDFFGKSTEGLAKMIEKAFKDHCRPNGYMHYTPKKTYNPF